MTRSRLTLVLVLAVAAALAGCGYGGLEEPPPGTPVPTQTLPAPTLSPNTTLVSALPRLLRVADGWHQFQVSAQQYELIGKRLHQVLKREGLWDQGVRFGANADPAKDYYFVLIDPGLSQLSARQILNRLLGVF
jgi:predicted small lipoprotein YifL